jgi:hypothetical protein
MDDSFFQDDVCLVAQDSVCFGTQDDVCLVAQDSVCFGTQDDVCLVAQDGVCFGTQKDVCLVAQDDAFINSLLSFQMYSIGIAHIWRPYHVKPT